MGGLTQETLTIRQESFGRSLFKGMEQAESYRLAGYKVDKMALTTLYANASRLANSAKVKAFLDELRAEARTAEVADYQERQKILSEIARANIPDYLTDDGIKVDKQSPNVGAVSEITTKTRVYRRTGEAINITNLKLHNPVSAIDLLNKMDKIYEVGGNIRDVNIVFVIGRGYANQPQLEEGKDAT